MKKIIIAFVVLAAVVLVVLVVTLLIVGSHLGDIVKAGMETEGPKFTQTTLTVDTVSIALLNGSAGIKNLVVGNPQGYTAPQCLILSNAAISLVPGSVLADKIVIHSVALQGLDVTFEGNPIGDNNLVKIMHNVEGAPSETPAAPAAPATNAPAAQPQPAGQAKPAKRFEVDDLVISGVQLHANITGLINRQITLPVPDIHMTGLGTDANGITAADLTKILIHEITMDSLKALTAYVGTLGKDLGGAAKGMLNDAVNGGTNSVNVLKSGLNSLLKR